MRENECIDIVAYIILKIVCKKLMIVAVVNVQCCILLCVSVQAMVDACILYGPKLSVWCCK